MKGDFTRWTYNQLKHYREVNMQQGRVQMDADWNEQNSIDFHYETASLQDIIGWAGTPVNSVTGYSDGFQIRFTDLRVAPATGVVSTSFTATGYGFRAGEKVDLAALGLKSSLATATASADGTFTISFTFPSSVVPGTYLVSARGELSGNSAVSSVELDTGPTLLPTPASGAPGTAIALNGYGFAAGEEVTFVVSPSSGASLSDSDADNGGSFLNSFAFPASTSPGTYTITATGSSSADTATATFDVTSTSLTMVPASGPAGTVFTILGYGFASGETVTFSMTGGTGVSIKSATAASDGSVNAPFTFPISASPGTYTITATGSSSTDTATANIFIIPNSPPIGFTIKHGHYYVNGVLCENEIDTYSNAQPDLPLFPGQTEALGLKGSAYLVYLDVWERHITYLDDPEIREVALLGPDTATRTKIVWQVKLLAIEPVRQRVTSPPSSVVGYAGVTSETQTPTVPAPASDTFATELPAAAAPRPETPPCLIDFPEWAALTAPSTGRLTARAKPTEPTGDPCEVPDQAGYTSLQNQLYRVEIHNEGVLGGKSGPTPTFKWSRDNGTVVSSITDIDTSDPTATVLTVTSTGKNPNLSFLNNMWVEVTSDINDLWGLPGSLALITSVNSSGQNTITIDPTSVVGSAIADEDYPPEQHPKVRRWDWDQSTPTPPQYPFEVSIPATNDGYIELEDGVEVKFSDGTYHTGDYWLIPARTTTADVDWPELVVGVDWTSVPSGGADAKALADFLIQRYGLDGIQASDFALSGTTEIDGSYTDPSGVSHTLSIALNDDQNFATLTVDGIVGAEIPVITESDGTLSLQCGFPEALGPEGIIHAYTRLALFEYEPTLQVLKPCPHPSIGVAAGTGEGAGTIFVGVSPEYATIPAGGSSTATVSVSFTVDGVDSAFQGNLSATVSPTGPTATLSADTVSLTTAPATVKLTVQVPAAVAEGCYQVEIVGSGTTPQGVPVSNTVYLTVQVPPPFVSPIKDATDCRLLFPALTDLPRLFYVSGDGQTAGADYSLPSPLMAAVWTGSVRFTVVKGSGTLSNSGATGSPGTVLDVKPGLASPDPTVYTDLEHIAWCEWTLDESTAVQVVKAEQLDNDGNLTDVSPIYFSAVLAGSGSQTTQAPAAAAAGPSPTTGIINTAIQPGSAVRLGPFNHYLTVTVPPAVLLAFEQAYAPIPGGVLDNMADASYFILAADKAAAGSLSLRAQPLASVVYVNTQTFYIDVVTPAGADSAPNYTIRWWAIPAAAQAAQSSAGVWISPSWVQAGSGNPIQISGAYFNSSAASITVNYSSATGATGNIATISPVPSDGDFQVANYAVPTSLTGYVAIGATDGTNDVFTRLYVVSISAQMSGTFPEFTITLTGSGFPPYGSVSVALDGGAVQLTQAVETDGGGNFSGAQFTTPSTLTGGVHTVSATVSPATATTSFLAVNPQAGEAKVPGSAAGSETTAKDVAAPAGSAVTVATGKDAKGPASPAAPRSASTTARVTASAVRRPATPQITLNVPTGPVGTDVAISGTGFTPNATVALAFNQRILPEVTTNAAGSFIATFRVPQTGSGSHTILARDESSGKTVSAVFKVP